LTSWPVDTLAREAARYREGMRYREGVGWHGDMGTRGVNKYSSERQDSSGLLGFEVMRGLLGAWPQQVAAWGEGQSPVIGPRIVIKPERHTPRSGLDAPLDLGVVGGDRQPARVDLRT